MKRLQRFTALGILCAALFAAMIAGCGKKGAVSTLSSNLPGSGSAAGSASGIAYDAATVDLQAGDTLAPLPRGFMGFPAGIPHGCAWDATSQGFVCNDVRPDGITGTHSYQFRDADSTPQSAYDSVTTASIRFASHLAGTHTHGHWGTVDDTRELVVSGLAGDEATRIWNGTGSSTRQDSVRTATGAMILVHTASTTTVAGVVVPKPWAPDSWPASGTVTTHVVSSDGTTTVDVTSVLTFNGTEYASMAIGGKTYVVDLKSPPHGPAGCPGGAPRDSLGGGQDSTGHHLPPPPPPPGGGGGGGDSTGFHGPPPPGGGHGHGH